MKLVRDTSRNPLFDVMFAYQNLENTNLELPNLKLQVLPGSATTSNFDLTLAISEHDGMLDCSIEYATELFKLDSIKRFAAYFKRITAEIVSNPSIRLSEIEILSSEERNQILKGFNDANPKLPSPESSIISLFERQVTLRPNNTALHFHADEVSYKELNSRVNKLCNYLLNEQSIIKGDIIGIHIERSPNMIIAMLATLKAGAAFVAFDKKITKHRFEIILSEADPKCILTDLDDQYAKEQRFPFLHLNQEMLQIEAMSDQNPEIEILPKDLAYLIYTSGSTGKPNGILIEHAALQDYVLTFQEYFSVTPTDRVIQQASIAFDTSIEEIFPALLSGASLIIQPAGGEDIHELVTSVKEKSATILSTIPTVINELNNYAEDLMGLRAVISGGETLKPAHIDQLIKKCAIFNTYGPSEATVCATYHRIEKLEHASYLGKPISNKKVLITDAYGQLSPILVPGELCIAGTGLARGYLNNEALTNEKFLPSQHLAGERMYKTGDMARWLPDGNIQFLGRRDDQIKIRGIRVEIGEIEKHLITHRNIREVAVIAFGEGRNKYLIAFYSAKEPLNDQSLITYMSTQLPSHMVPYRYEFLSQLPLTLSGKINRRALSEQVPPVDLRQNRQKAANQTERELVGIWSDILKLDGDVIGVTTNFFELGGNSLLATLMANKIRKKFKVQLPLIDIFSMPFIKAIAEKLRLLQIDDHGQDELTVLLKGSTNEKNHLFAIHDGSGDVQSYLGYSEFLVNYNFWGLRSTTLSKLGPENLKLENLAKSYINRIKSIQSSGPYRLMGWSFGGIIACEIASQLEKEGETIDFLMTIDSVFPNIGSKADLLDFSEIGEKQFVEELLEEKIFDSNDVGTSDVWKGVVELAKRDQNVKTKIQSGIPMAYRQLIPQFETLDAETLINHGNTIRTLRKAILRYTPGIKLKVSPICIESTKHESDPKTMSHYYGQSTRISIEGDHYSIMKGSAVQEMANQVNKLLPGIELKNEASKY